jgi:hypothetical protein
MHFLDETSAYLASTMLFRKNMLEEYKKQLDAWIASDKDSKLFEFGAWSYNYLIQYAPSDALARTIT